jgi:hypothetical protein
LTSDNIKVTVTLDSIGVFDTILAFLILLLALLTSSPALRGEKYLWNCNVPTPKSTAFHSCWMRLYKQKIQIAEEY